MTPVKHLRTRFPLHKNLNKWYWIQPWPLVLLSISTTSVPVYPPVRPITHDRVEDPSVQLAAPSSHQPMSTGKKYKTVMLGIIRGIHTIYKLYWTGIVTENKIMRWLSNTDLDVAAIKLGNVADVPVDMMCYFLLFKKTMQGTTSESGTRILLLANNAFCHQPDRSLKCVGKKSHFLLPGLAKCYVSRKTDVGCQINSGFSATFKMTLIEKKWQSGVERLPQLRCDWIQSFSPVIPGCFTPRVLHGRTARGEVS